MIRIITADQYDACRPLLRQMFRLRYRVFKERLGWDVQTIGDEERDEFDLLDPVYILVLNDDDDVTACWRLLPTTGPNMLRDVFPHLLTDRPIPSAPGTWECSRFAVDCATDGENCLANLNRVTSELFCGLIHFCLQKDIGEVVTVYDIRIGRILPRVGCSPRWRTKPQRIGNFSALVGLFDINNDVLTSVMENAEFYALVEHGPDQLEPMTSLPPLGGPLYTGVTTHAH